MKIAKINRTRKSVGTVSVNLDALYFSVFNKDIT